MKITANEIVEGIKVVASAALPVAVAFGISGGDITALSDAAQGFVVAGAALIVAARKVAGDIRNRGK